MGLFERLSLHSRSNQRRLARRLAKTPGSGTTGLNFFYGKRLMNRYRLEHRVLYTEPNNPRLHLEHPTLRAMFARSCALEFSSENIEAADALEYLGELVNGAPGYLDDERLIVPVRFYDEFIAPDAPRTLNITDQLRTDYLTAMRTRQGFGPVLKELNSHIDLHLKDVLMRHVLRSAEFGAWAARTRAKFDDAG